MIRIFLGGRLADAVGTSRYDADTHAPATVRMALSDLLSKYPELRAFIWDDAAVPLGTVMFCVDSVPVSDPVGLSDMLRPDSCIHIIKSSGPRVDMAWSTDWRQRRLTR